MNTNVIPDPNFTPTPPPVFTMGIANITGTIPTEYLAVGPTSGHVAAGDDPRFTHDVRSLDSVAALRALPVPIPGTDPLVVQTHAYYADLLGGGNRFRWNADSIDADNGGTVIRPDALNAPTGGQPGRWLAANYNSALLECAQFGAVPGADSVANSAAIQAANDALPLYSGAEQYLTPPPRSARVRQGVLRLPAGTLNCHTKLYISNGVRFEGAGALDTRLVFDAGVYDAAHPTWMIEFENAVGVDLNNYFGGGISGLFLDCGANPGSSGITLIGAQGTRLDDVIVVNFGLRGVVFTGAEIGTLWVAGNGSSLGPGLTLQGYGGQNQLLVRAASVEHLNTAGTLDAQGNQIPYVLISGSGVVIDVLEGEALGSNGNLYCQIDSGRNITVRHCSTSGMNGTGP